MLKKICTGLSMLCFVVVVFAQDSEDENEINKQNTKRPSWSAGMPERQKAAELNKPQFKPEPDQEIELDMSEFGLQRKPNVEIDLPINADIAGVPVKASKTDQAAEQAALEQAALEQAALEQAALEQAALEQAALEQAALEQAALEQAAAEQAALEQAAAEQAALEQAALEQAAAEQQALIDEAKLEVAEDALNPVTTDVVEAGSSPASQDSVALSEERTLASVNPAVSGKPDDVTQEVVDQTKYSWNILKRTPLEYPVKAAIKNLEGWVEIEVTINPAGEVLSASAKDFSRSGRIFGKPAEESVNNWLFEPPSNIGITTNLTRIYKVEFNL